MQRELEDAEEEAANARTAAGQPMETAEHAAEVEHQRAVADFFNTGRSPRAG
jgi:hypothetical protein